MEPAALTCRSVGVQKGEAVVILNDDGNWTQYHTKTPNKMSSKATNVGHVAVPIVRYCSEMIKS